MPTNDLTKTQRERILRDVVLGVPAPDGESEAARQWREQCRYDVARCKEQGYMPEIPFDPDGSED